MVVDLENENKEKELEAPSQFPIVDVSLAPPPENPADLNDDLPKPTLIPPSEVFQDKVIKDAIKDEDNKVNVKQVKSIKERVEEIINPKEEETKEEETKEEETKEKIDDEPVIVNEEDLDCNRVGKPEIQYTKTGRIKKPISEERKKQLAEARKKAMEVRKAKAEKKKKEQEERERKKKIINQERKEASVLKRKKKKEIIIPPTPSTSEDEDEDEPIKLERHTRYYTREQLEEAVLTGVELYDKKRKKEKAKNKIVKDKELQDKKDTQQVVDAVNKYNDPDGFYENCFNFN